MFDTDFGFGPFGTLTIVGKHSLFYLMEIGMVGLNLNGRLYYLKD